MQNEAESAAMSVSQPDSSVGEGRLPKAEFLEKLNKLNRELAVHANRKELQQSMALFDEAISKGWANAHTYAAAINCNVRCGNLVQATRLLERLKKHGRGIKADVIHYTTVLKGHCERGDMQAASAILHDMVIRRVSPNVRTVNTYLRGCVQTGGVALADKVVQNMVKEYNCNPDVSSWEYLVTLLAQGLRLEKCLPIVGRLKSDASMVTGLSSIYVQVARAAALLGEHKTARRSIQSARDALKADEERTLGENGTIKDYDADSDGDNDVDATTATATPKATGGKRAWREGALGDARSQSLTLFREHKISELRQELALVEGFLAQQQAHTQNLEQFRSYFMRVLSLHTAISDTDTDGDADTRTDSNTTVEQLVEGLLLRFGLGAILSRLSSASIANSPSASASTRTTSSPSSAAAALAKSSTKIDATFSEPLSKKDKIKAQVARKRERERELDKEKQSLLYGIPPAYIEIARSHMRKCVNDNGCFNFGAVFGADNSSKPLKLEICSGAGEWAVAQAQADPSSNYVTLELRHDRVYQTFYRAVCAQTQNLCTVGGDANVVLKKHIAANSLANIFINHPEPPQQTGAERGGSEGKHLLTLDFFAQAGRVLQTGGLLTIVTDNNWYARFLIRLLSTAPHPRSLGSVELLATSGCRSVEEEGGFKAYLGKPGKDCGHTVDASSYFDRLWKRGNLVDRYIIVLKKTSGDPSNLRIRQYKKGAAPTDVDTSIPASKKIKFDDDSD